MKITTDIADAIVGAMKTALDGGHIYIFSGTVPDSAEDDLDMINDHTQLAKISISDTGTGLTWDSPANGVILKPVADTWEGLNEFDGVDAATPTLTATFARFCPSGDDGRGQATTERVQFCISGPAGSCELMLNSTSITDDGFLKTSVDFARIVQPLG